MSKVQAEIGKLSTWKVYYTESLGDRYPIRTNVNRMPFGIFSKTSFSLSVILEELHL